MHKCVVFVCLFYLILLKYIIDMKEFGLTETKLFHVRRIFKAGGKGFQVNPLLISHCR